MSAFPAEKIGAHITRAPAISKHSASTAVEPILRVAVPSPLHRLFDYLPPEGSANPTWRPGQRLAVPFGSRTLTAIVIEVAQSSELAPARLRRAQAVLDPDPLLPASLLLLLRWVADYYQHPPGEVYPAAFPARLRRPLAHTPRRSRHFRLTVAGKGLPPGAPRRAPRQAEALSLLTDQSLVAESSLVAAGISPAVLRALQERGLIETVDLAPATAAASPTRSSGASLSAEQAAAVAAIGASVGFAGHLLEGVTGSGKTEVYLHCIAQVLARGQQALVLLPEIGLTPQTLARFEQRFATRIAVVHSGLTDAARCDAWEAGRSGAAGIVLGTRSAIFTPLARPGLIVVDEEHDAAFKQQDGLRYSARDVAVKRAQLEAVPVVLGSATPSLESLHNAITGRYQHLRLTARAGGASLPERHLLDIRRAPLQAGLAPALLDAVRRHLQQGQQVLLFLNRRGFAPTLQCHDCAFIANCKLCDARLTVHATTRLLRCHHCGASAGLPRQCPSCGSQQLLTRGVGTEQLAHFLAREFPNTPLRRMDSDSIASRGALLALLDDIAAGGAQIILGTQMLSKGHHFPLVTLVGVVDADSSLFSADPRSEERMAQLITQVAGRAGREQLRGEVLIQTHHPDHPVLQTLLDGDYHGHARAMLEARAQAALPPWRRLVLLRAEARHPEDAAKFLLEVRTSVEVALPSATHLLGPLPAPLARRAGYFRSQLLLNAPEHRSAQRAARLLRHAATRQAAPRDLRWALDVDPLDLF